MTTTKKTNDIVNEAIRTVETPKLSVLIPTHKRPKLFYRCLESVLHKIPDNVEVIVNNDSCDIETKHHDRVLYHFKNYELTQIYKFLVDQAKGEYIYFLEDDDYMVKGFYTVLPKLRKELYIGKYIPCKAETGDDVVSRPGFFDLDSCHFQLPQVIFKRELFNELEWPKDNDIHNDYKITKHFALKYGYTFLNKFLYHQTTDGMDNISFDIKNIIKYNS